MKSIIKRSNTALNLQHTIHVVAVHGVSVIVVKF